MREILFKGKRVDNDEWVYGFLVKMWGLYHIIDQNDENSAYMIKPETVGQYTGVCDTNDKKIFEGDIVKVTIGVKGYRTTYNSVNCTVEFRSDNCGIAVFYPFTNSNIIETEVIGNKYDNKEAER